MIFFEVFVLVLVLLLFRFHIPIILLRIMPFEMVLHPVNKQQNKKKNWNLNVNTSRRKIFYVLNIRNTYMARDVCCNRLEWNFCVWVRCLICYVFVYTIFVVRTLFLFCFFHIFASACLSFIYFFFIRIIWWTIRKWKLVCFDIHTTPIEIYWLCITYHSQKQHRHNKDDNFS